MFQYVLDLDRIHGFDEKYPTLLQKRRKLAKNDQRFADAEETMIFIGKSIHEAGMRFLERIHQENWEKLPQHAKDAIEEERRKETAREEWETTQKIEEGKD